MPFMVQIKNWVIVKKSSPKNLSAIHQPTAIRRQFFFFLNLSVTCWLAVGRMSVTCRSTVGRQLNDSRRTGFLGSSSSQLPRIELLENKQGLMRLLMHDSGSFKCKHQLCSFVLKYSWHINVHHKEMIFLLSFYFTVCCHSGDYKIHIFSPPCNMVSSICVILSLQKLFGVNLVIALCSSFLCEIYLKMIPLHAVHSQKFAQDITTCNTLQLLT